MLTMDDGVHEPIDAYSPTFMRPRRTLIVDALPYGDGVLFLALNNGSSFYSLRSPLRSPHSVPAFRNSAFETDALLQCHIIIWCLRCCCCAPFCPGLIMPFYLFGSSTRKKWLLWRRHSRSNGGYDCAITSTMEVSVLNPRSAICHVHLHDLSHATAIVFMITGLALIFYGPPWRSSSCHLHGPP